MSVEAQAMENVLKTERVHKTFSYPLTGDDEVDAMSAICALMSSSGLPPQAWVRIGNWLSARMTDQVKLSNDVRNVPNVAGSGWTPGIGIMNPVMDRSWGGVPRTTASEIQASKQLGQLLGNASRNATQNPGQSPPG